MALPGTALKTEAESVKSPCSSTAIINRYYAEGVVCRSCLERQNHTEGAAVHEVFGEWFNATLESGKYSNGGLSWRNFRQSVLLISSGYPEVTQKTLLSFIFRRRRALE
jgi:hypothetical protein